MGPLINYIRTLLFQIRKTELAFVSAIRDNNCPPPGQCTQNSDCNDGEVCTGGGCTQGGGSPIILDITGKEFLLTSAKDGVDFDFFGTGTKVRIAWTAISSDNAWLVLDRDGNGRIDRAKEMFGNITAQPKPSTPNGFLALAEFDRIQNGGNGDGIIDKHDAIFSKLRPAGLVAQLGTAELINMMLYSASYDYGKNGKTRTIMASQSRMNYLLFLH